MSARRFRLVPEVTVLNRKPYTAIWSWLWLNVLVRW